jgi:hypothetical protein
MEVLDNLGVTKSDFKDRKKGDTAQAVVAVGVSLAVLFATIWVVGRAWKTSQKA